MPRKPTLRTKTINGHEYYVTAAGGKMKYFGKVGETSYKDAQAAFFAYVAEPAAAPKRATSTGPTVADAIKLYLAGIDVSHDNRIAKQSTLNIFAAHVVGSGDPSLKLTHVGRKLGSVPAVAITKAHVLDFAAGRDVGPTTIYNNLTHVKAAWAWLADREHLPADPLAKLKRPSLVKRPKSEAELITRDEYRKLVKHANDDIALGRGGKPMNRKTHPHDEFRDVLVCLHDLGCRPIELCRLRVRDVNLSRSSATLRDEKTSKKTGKTREIILSDDVKAIFRRRIKGKRPADFVLTTKSGGPYTRHTIANRIRSLREHLGMRNVAAYDFRHLWVSDLMETDVPLGTIAEMAGTSIAMIERTYGHIRNESKRAAMATLKRKRR